MGPIEAGPSDNPTIPPQILKTNEPPVVISSSSLDGVGRGILIGTVAGVASNVIVGAATPYVKNKIKRYIRNRSLITYEEQIEGALNDDYDNLELDDLRENENRNISYVYPTDMSEVIVDDRYF